MGGEENQYYQGEIKKLYDDIGYSFVQTEEDAIKAIRSSVKTILVVSGKEGSSLIPKLRDGLKEVNNLQSAIVFCGPDSVKEFKKSLKKKFPDFVKLVTSDFDLKLLPEIGKQIKETAQAQIMSK